MSTRKRSLIAVAAIVMGCLLPTLASAQSEGDPEILRAVAAGDAARQAGNFEGAIVEYDKGISLDTDGTTTLLYFGKAEALRQLEDYQEAIKLYTRAQRADENFARIYNGRGISLREIGQAEMALNDFRSAVELDRSDPEIAANLGDILVSYQQFAQAMSFLDRAIEITAAGDKGADAKVYRNRGWAHASLGEFEEGIADLNKAIELDPEDYETYQRVATAHLYEQNYQLGIDAISKAIDYYKPKDNSEPDSYINGYLQLAEVRMLLAKEKETTAERDKLYEAVAKDADAVLREFPDRYPQSGRALYLKGKASRMRGLFAEAITALTDAIRLVPPGEDSNYVGAAYLIRGISWFYQGQNSLARGDFKEAASHSLEDPLPHLWIGFTHAVENEHRKAIKNYGEAASKNPTFALAFVNRGLAYMQLKDYGKAVDNFNEAIRAEPTEPKHFHKRGVAHELLGEPQKALDSYQLALLRDGDFADANLGSARVMRTLGRPGLGNQYDNRIKTLP